MSCAAHRRAAERIALLQPVKVQILCRVVQLRLGIARVRHVKQQRLAQARVFLRRDHSRRALRRVRAERLRGAAVLPRVAHRLIVGRKLFRLRNEQQTGDVAFPQRLFGELHQAPADAAPAERLVCRDGIEVGGLLHLLAVRQRERQGKEHRDDRTVFLRAEACRLGINGLKKTVDLRVRVAERLLPERFQRRNIIRPGLSRPHQKPPCRSAVHFSSSSVGW